MALYFFCRSVFSPVDDDNIYGMYQMSVNPQEASAKHTEADSGLTHLLILGGRFAIQAL